MGMMPSIAIQGTLSAMIFPPALRHQASSVNHSSKCLKITKDKDKEKDRRERNLPPKRTKMATLPVLPSWKAIVENGNQFFSLSSHLQPLDTTLNCPEPGLCGKLLLQGYCQLTGCRCGPSHSLIQALDTKQCTAVEKWFSSTYLELKLN
jgi:hypothetical protein